jgi:hypothetical protein
MGAGSMCTQFLVLCRVLSGTSMENFLSQVNSSTMFQKCKQHEDVY